jgi:hypothetical protein
MLKTYAHGFAALTTELTAFAMSLGPLGELSNERLGRDTNLLELPEIHARVEEWLSKAEKWTAELNMRSSHEWVSRLRRERPWMLPRFAHHLEQARSRISDDLKQVNLLLVPLSKIEFYDNPWFGEEIETRFPDARDDMREAGRCFAVGAYSGVVLHCMGIVQTGLEELAHHLGRKIDIQIDDWNTIITKIEGGVGAKRKVATDQNAARRVRSNWARVEPYYTELISDARAVKNAWRNPGFHFRRRDFNERTARKVIDKVRDLMADIAKILPKKRR